MLTDTKNVSANSLKVLLTDPPVAYTHSYTTSTFQQKVKDETKNVRGSGRAYNPDVDPPQSPYLKQPNHDIGNHETREILLKHSNFLREHTYDILEEKMRLGWKLIKSDSEEKDVYEDVDSIGREIDWSNDLKRAFIDATAKALVIDTTYIVKFSDDTFKVFTHNDEYRIFANNNRKITEAYFSFPGFDNFYHEDTGNAFANTYVGVLTQYTDDKIRENRYKMLIDDPDEIYRDAIVIQPIPSVRNPHGEVYLYRECQTASEKIHLRFYELLYIHKGGVNITTVIPTGQTQDIKDNAVIQARRGMLSRGTVMEIQSGHPINDVMMLVQTPIPDLKFDTVNSHLSEDAKLTKQKIEGSAESGALGGQSPIINKIQDEETKESLLLIMEKVIKDVNQVFFNLNPKSYRVEFNKPKIETMEENEMNDSIKEKDNMNEFANQYFDSEEYEFMSPDVEIYAHSINDEFVTYEGNMLQAGTYFYPEKNKSEVFTKEDIKRLCERDVKTGYLEFNHSFKENVVGINEGIGYFEIIGYDDLQGKDITRFHIKKKIAEEHELKDKIKVSPYFFNRNRRYGGKDIFIKNCAVVTEGKPRADLTPGLDTSAIKTF